MIFDLPPGIERRIQEFAKDQHITSDEAIVLLILAGLMAIKPISNPADPSI